MWWITRKIRTAYKREFQHGYEVGFQMGQLHAIKMMLYYHKILNGEPTTLAEKQIEAILWKAEEEERN